jgi:hypothetical protein
MGQGRNAGMDWVSLVIQLIEVDVEPIFPWNFGEELLGTGNLSLMVLFGEPRDIVMGNHAGFLGELKEPEGAIVMPWLAGAMKTCLTGPLQVQCGIKKTYKQRPSLPTIHPALNSFPTTLPH